MNAFVFACILLGGIAGVLAQAPLHDRLERIRADLFSRPEHLDQDVRDLKEILAADPRSVEAHTLLGIAYRAIGTQDLMGESIAEFRQALDIDPSLVPVRLYLARVYLDLGRAARAKEELETALTQAPGNPQLLSLLGESERQLKNPSRAVEVLQQTLKADESSVQARYYLGLALLDLGQRDDAIRELERVVQSSPPVSDPYLTLGTLYLNTGRAAEAIQTLNQGVHIDPRGLELHIQLARAYRTKGLLDKAEAQLALAAPKDGAAPAMSAYQYQQVELDLNLERGFVKLQRGQLVAAGDAFKKVLAMDPNNEQATRGLAEVNRKKKAGGGK